MVASLFRRVHQIAVLLLRIAPNDNIQIRLSHHSPSITIRIAHFLSILAARHAEREAGRAICAA
jgi:hypothetical protein